MENAIMNDSLVNGADIADAMIRADELAATNTRGGPFGAVILGADGQMIGEGRNEVVATNDPTAHAEMQALRNAALLNPEKLQGATLVTSCECCPMCLAGAYAAGIGHIIYSNTRQDAADIGFADDAIYEEMHADFAALDIRLAKSGETIASLLPDDADACVVDGSGAILSTASHLEATAGDVVSLPSLLAVSRACRALGAFHLPDGSTLITRTMVHPLGFTAARWAHIQHIVVLDEAAWEGEAHAHHPQTVYADIALPLQHMHKRRIPMRRTEDNHMLSRTKSTFDRWFSNANKVLY